MVRLPERGSEDHIEEAPSLAALSQEVKELVRLISSTDISELHLESGQVRITIKRGAVMSAAGLPQPSAVYTPPAMLPSLPANSPVSKIGHDPVHGEEIALGADEQLIVAPMVGTYYSAPAPNEPPFLQEGDHVEPGQAVGIIEAMKMMNTIESEVEGRVLRILVQNAQPVEYGQPLMVVQTET
ncbi:MAG TPA: acetyl-CoA carboxylase biotin carboxyl carrier protein [Chloroflexia bacterium]|jgi:acetyl-CoA carboxylase biotin carboxyl carrier protein